MKIAKRHATSHAMAVNARNLLTGAHLIYKSGRHYYTAPLTTETGQADDREHGADEHV
jgi:hypothetical protein